MQCHPVYAAYSWIASESDSFYFQQATTDVTSPATGVEKISFAKFIRVGLVTRRVPNKKRYIRRRCILCAGKSSTMARTATQTESERERERQGCREKMLTGEWYTVQWLNICQRAQQALFGIFMKWESEKKSSYARRSVLFLCATADDATAAVLVQMEIYFRKHTLTHRTTCTYRRRERGSGPNAWNIFPKCAVIIQSCDKCLNAVNISYWIWFIHIHTLSGWAISLWFYRSFYFIFHPFAIAAFFFLQFDLFP